MSKSNVSRCTIPTKKANKNLYVKVKNSSQNLSRQFIINVYKKDSSTKELLPVYLDDQLMPKDKLNPGAEKVYRIDVSSVEGKVIFEIMQTKGGSGIKVTRKSNSPTTVEVEIKE